MNDKIETPLAYKCNCDASGVKLWRPFNGEHYLICATCLCNLPMVAKFDPSSILEDGTRLVVPEGEKKPVATRVIDWHIPALPKDASCREFYNLSNVLDATMNWWIALPLRAE